MADHTSLLCAHCQRCGRRSVVGNSTVKMLADDPEQKPQLRCDMCGGRRVRIFEAQGPGEMLAFLNGRL